MGMLIDFPGPVQSKKRKLLLRRPSGPAWNRNPPAAVEADSSRTFETMPDRNLRRALALLGEAMTLCDQIVRTSNDPAEAAEFGAILEQMKIAITLTSRELIRCSGPQSAS